MFDNMGDAVTYWRMFHHVIWSTKNREALIGDEEQRLIERSFALTLNDLDVVTHAVGFMPDHVHLAVSIPPRIAVAEAVRRLKGGSSHAVNHRKAERAEGFAWQSEYGVLTFGERALPAVVCYVREQRERYAAQSVIRALERTDETP